MPKLHYTTELFELYRVWLSPEGKWVVASENDTDAFHEGIANDILMNHHGFEDKHEFHGWWLDREETSFVSYFYEEVEKMGWVRLHGYWGQAKNAQFILDTELTFHQKQAIKRWCKINNVSWDDAVQKC